LKATGIYQEAPLEGVGAASKPGVTQSADWR